MTREQARNEVNARYAEYLKPAKKRGTFICPLCGNGTGADGDGLTVNKKNPDGHHLKCFKCGFAGDLVELYQQEHKCSTGEAFKGLYAYFGIFVDDDRLDVLRQTDADDHREPTPQISAETTDEAPQAEQGEVQRTDFTRYYNTVRANIDAPAAAEYLSKRGISLETARRYWLGYDPAWVSPTVVKNQEAKGSTWRPDPSPRIIIPANQYSYTARDTRPSAAKWKKMKEGESELFNVKALYNARRRPVFITEGEFDCLSIIEAGAEAVALGSTNNRDKLIQQLKKRPTHSTLIICLDKDDAGQKATEQLCADLKALGVSYMTGDVSEGAGDPNEALQRNRGLFLQAVAAAERSAADRPDTIKDYILRQMHSEIERFKTGADHKTGFANLDDIAGGVFPGLYVLGAITSLGKTTFIHQIGDQMAEAGEHVIYFSLEQSRLEMVSKSLARLTYRLQPKKAVTSLQIRKGYTDAVVQDAIELYCGTAGDRMNIVEGNFDTTVSFIGDYIARYMERNKVKPVIIIDYLQALQPDDTKRQTAREIIDTTVQELKRISRNRDIPIFLISSLNRSNYMTPVDNESFKESGGIEYTADVVWGLQLEALNDGIFDYNKDSKVKEKREKINQAKAEIPRRVELVCLKNRYGIASYKTTFEYYPQYDTFRPAPGAAAKQTATRRI